MIVGYRFGEIVIDGKSYDHDIIIHPDHIQENWWREKGHLLQLDDIQESLNRYQPHSLVIGTGKFGVMKIDQAVKVYLENNHIQLYAEPTGKAIKVYNRILMNDNQLIGAFHLTC